LHSVWHARGIPAERAHIHGRIPLARTSAQRPFTAAARSWKLRIWRWGVAWRKGGSRSGSAGRPMPVLGRAGQPRSHRGRRPNPPPSLWRSFPPGSGKGEACSTGGAGRAASWSGGSSPPGSGESRGWACSGGRGCRAGVAPPPCLPVQEGWTRCYAEEGRTARANQLSHILA